MGKKEVNPVRQQWSYIFFALTHRNKDVILHTQVEVYVPRD